MLRSVGPKRDRQEHRYSKAKPEYLLKPINPKLPKPSSLLNPRTPPNPISPNFCSGFEVSTSRPQALMSTAAAVPWQGGSRGLI